MSKVVIISTHFIGGSLFPINELGLYSNSLATYFNNKYGLNNHNKNDEPTLTIKPVEVLKSIKEILNDDNQFKAWAKRINVEEHAVLYEILSAIDTWEGDQEFKDTVKKQINGFLYVSNMKEQSRGFSLEEAKNQSLPIPEPKGRSLFDVAYMYAYINNEKDGDYQVYGVYQLAKPEEKTDGSWKWVSALKSAAEELKVGDSDLDLILLLHDQDLSEYGQQSFQCVEKTENCTIAIFQHSDVDVSNILSGKLSSKDIYCSLETMLSNFAKMGNYNDSNRVFYGYQKLI